MSGQFPAANLRYSVKYLTHKIAYPVNSEKSNGLQGTCTTYNSVVQS